jgi:N-acetylglutamate synthase
MEQVPADRGMIRAVEEVALTAWPAHQLILDDGWLLRFAAGYTKRANSVNPVYPSRADLDAKLARAEAAYAERGLPTVFRLTPLAEPEGLDGALDARGYEMQSPTLTQTVDLARVSLPPALPENTTLRLSPEFEPGWLDALGALTGLAAADRPAVQRILQMIPVPTAYARLEESGELRCMALGRLVAGHLIIDEVATAPEGRRRGFARMVIQAIVAWAREGGATRGCLQVVGNNDPAIALYHELGFRTLYRYHYRVKSSS